MKVADQSVPDWDNQKALTIFEQMLQKDEQQDRRRARRQRRPRQRGHLGAQGAQAQADPGHRPGRDAEGIQNILAGDQCMTVYKAIKKEADAASKLAIALAKKQTPAAGLVNGQSNDTKRQVPSVLLKPQAITKDNVNVVFDDGFPKKADVCTGKYAQLCTAAGV